MNDEGALAAKDVAIGDGEPGDYALFTPGAGRVIFGFEGGGNVKLWSQPFTVVHLSGSECFTGKIDRVRRAARGTSQGGINTPGIACIDEAWIDDQRFAVDD